MEEYGPVVPLLRCQLHSPILNISYSGDIYETGLFWETDPNTRALMRRLGPGPKDSRKMRLTALDADDQKPLEGVDIETSELIAMSLPLPPRHLKTDARGECEINLASKNPNSLALRISRPGYATSQMEWDSGDMPAEWTAKLQKAAAIGGVVRDPAGKPIPGARVTVDQRSESGEDTEMDVAIFNEWKSASPVSFPIGRVSDKSEKSKWASDVPALPWLILTDPSHRVIAEGFAFDELEAQLKKVSK
jgi:hypothetical protein